MVAPKHPPALTREKPAPAPYLTEDGRCSDCNVKPVQAAKGEMIVCPSCYGLLWHVDNSAEQRAAAKEELLAARAAAAAQRQAIIDARELAKPHKRIRIIKLSISSPVISAPVLGVMESTNESD